MKNFGFDSYLFMHNYQNKNYIIIPCVYESLFEESEKWK